MKKHRRFLILFLGLLFPGFAFGLAAETPISISTIEELQRIGNDPEYPLYESYVLTGNIDASATAEWNDGSGFIPIGAPWTGFSGVFDGMGYVVRNLVIFRSGLWDHAGLFDTIGPSGIVRNLGLEGGRIEGEFYTGALVGLNGGSISDCYARVQMIGEQAGGLVGVNWGEISSSHASGAVEGFRFAGGLVGRNDGRIAYSFGEGAVYAHWRDAGGLAGVNTGRISKSYAAGTVTGRNRTGGLVGSNSSWGEGVGISDCYAVGAVVGLDSWWMTAGGLAGFNAGEIVRCYAAGPVTADGAGGLVGERETERSSFWDVGMSGIAETEDAGGRGKTTEEMMSQFTFEGWDFEEIWTIIEGETYPSLRGIASPAAGFRVNVSGANGTVDQSPAGPDHLPWSLVRLSAVAEPGYEFSEWVGITNRANFTVRDNPISVAISGDMTIEAVFLPVGPKEVNTVADLARIGTNLEWPLHGSYVLTADLDASETATWNDGAGFAPIGSERIPFDGRFDGQGHFIRNLTINRPGESGIGLFRKIGASGEVRNVGLKGGSIAGKDDVGALAGKLAGTISTCFSTAYVRGEGSVTGGLVGSNRGLVTNSRAGGTVWGRGDTGGLVGEHYQGEIKDSFASGIVFGGVAAGGLAGRGYEGKFTDSYAVGHVHGKHGSGGGIGGRLSGGIVISNSFWDVETTGQDDSYGSGGRSTAEMMSEETFSGWDFESTWVLVEGTTYPWLRALAPAAERFAVTVEAVNGSVHRSEVGPEYDQGSLVWLTAEADPGYAFAGWAGEDLPGHLLLRANPLPVAVWESTTWTAVFAPAGPRELSTVEDLAKIGRDREWPLHWAYFLSGDIDASMTAGWNDGAGFDPIGRESPFTGHLDGRGHAVQGLVINRPDEEAIGLFGVIGRLGVVENLGIEGGSVSGGSVGSLAGRNDGSVEWCHSSAAVVGLQSGGLIGFNDGNLHMSRASGNVSGDWLAGGLAASNGGKVVYCYATGRVTGNSTIGGLVGENNAGGFNWENSGVIAECFAAGSVTGEYQIGGLVGVSEWGTTIRDCFALGFVTGYGEVGGLVGWLRDGELIQSYAAGKVSGNHLTGGLAGQGAIPFNYWDVDTTGQEDPGDGAWGKSTEAMMSQATYGDWDFAKVWMLQEGQTYPRLRAIKIEPEAFPLVVDSDFGSVSRNPAGPQYAQLTLVRLTAEPDAGYAFAGWVGDDLPDHLTANSLTLSVSKSMTLRAVFLPAGAKEIEGIGDLAKIGHDPEWPLHWDYVLTGDIDASDTANWDDGEGFLAIGADQPFTGDLDGQGHRILGLTIARRERERGALFAEIGQGGVVRNLGLEGGSIVSFSAAAGLALTNYGFIANCYTHIDVAGELETAGLVVSNYGEIRNSYSMSQISAAMNRPFEMGTGGGLVAINEGGIVNCYAAGIISTPEENRIFGGLVALNNGEVHSSFWDREASGVLESHSGRGLMTEQINRAVVFQNAGWAGGAWVHDDGADYPRLAWENKPGLPIANPEPLAFNGSGTYGDPYLIQTADDFVSLAWHVSVRDKHFRMTKDLDLKGMDLHPIGELGDFTGTFNGGGFSVANGVVDRPGSELAGLFNRVGPGGRIQFFGAETMRVTGSSIVGVLAGENEGAIVSCFVEGEVHQTSELKEDPWSAGGAIGGLVGENSGSIFRTYANVAVAGKGESFVGGLVGRSPWEGEIAESYSCGLVTGDYGPGDYYELGGFLGTGYGVRSFWDIERSGLASSSGATGKSTAEMMREGTFTTVGWDFATVWAIEEGVGYPILRRGTHEVIAPATFPEWAGQTTLPPGEQTMSADPGGYGITNLERYAFGLDPNRPNRAHLPVGSIGKRYGYEFLSIGYWESVHAVDIRYVVEASSDLKTWDALPEFRRIENDRDANWRSVRYYDQVTLNRERRRFLRVRVEVK